MADRSIIGRTTFTLQSYDWITIRIFHRWRRRTVLNEFIRNTEVSRVDKPREFFQFTENFHGNAPLQVLNIQNVPSNSPPNLPDYEPSEYLDRIEPRYIQVNIRLFINNLL